MGGGISQLTSPFVYLRVLRGSLIENSATRSAEQLVKSFFGE
jgi:hypothetical protein